MKRKRCPHTHLSFEESVCGVKARCVACRATGERAETREKARQNFNRDYPLPAQVQA